VILDFGCSSGWFTERAHSQEWQSSWQIVACDSWLQPDVAQGDSLAIVGWLVKCYYHVLC
jgi:hypothetical protein